MKQTLEEKTKHVYMGFPNDLDFRPSGLETTFTKAKSSHQVKTFFIGHHPFPLSVFE